MQVDDSGNWIGLKAGCWLDCCNIRNYLGADFDCSFDSFCVIMGANRS